jgi:ATP-dependent RNA helicase DeaD
MGHLAMPRHDTQCLNALEPRRMPDVPSATDDLTPQTTVPSPDAGAVDFPSLGLEPKLVASLTALGYEEPTPIQRAAIPHLLGGKNLVGQAATGTGKTAAFTLPIVQRLATTRPTKVKDREGVPSALVLVPTRELAMQVAEAVHKYGRPFHTSVLPLYGGQAYGPQLRALGRGVDVVVATPGRALDHIRRGTLKLDGVSTVVLDEADEMLDMGFADDLEAILGASPSPGRQMVLFSATLPPRIASIARKYVNEPVRIKIGGEKVAAGDTPRVRQTAYVVPRGHKLAALGRVLDAESPEAAIVFCRRRNEVDELTEAINGRGYRAEALHGGMTQDQRGRVMKKFRDGKLDLLIATDVAARGLDIEHLSHVFNFDVPCQAESYVHRIGRVGRAGREGVAITLAEPREHRQLQEIERSTKQKIEIARVPTVADLRSRRLELARAAVREAIVAGELEPFRSIAEALADEFDPMTVAMAAIGLVHRSLSPDTDGEGAEEEEIPDVTPRREGPLRRSGGAGHPGSGGRDRGGPPSRRGFAPDRPRRQGGPAFAGPSPGATRLFIGAGRNAGVRPQDLVGAITGEAGIHGRQIGAIEIADRYALVEVDGAVADHVVAALRGASIKGKKVAVRRAAEGRDS